MVNEAPVQEKLIRLAEDFHPYSAHWDITARCNASCDYCYVDDNGQPDLPTADMLRIADALAANGILYVNLSGGEPFLRPDILTILDRVFANNFFTVSIYSNATLITDEHLRYLIEHRHLLTSLQFSVFSHHPELHDRYMGVPGSLKKIIATGEALRNAGIQVTMAFTVLDFNLKEFSESRAYFSGLGFTVRPSIMRIVPDHNRDGMPEELYSEQYYRDCLQILEADLTDSLRNSMATCLERKRERGLLCTGLRDSISIDPTGNVHPCPLFTELTVGNILEPRPIRSMLRECSEYQRIRAIRVQDMPECAACRFNAFCDYCLAGRKLEHGDYFKPQRQCCNLANAVFELTGEKGAE